MSTTTAPDMHDVDLPIEAGLQYRELSRGAVAAGILAVLSMLAFLHAALVPIPLIGLVVGLASWLSIRRHPNEYAGRHLAIGSALVCAWLLVFSTVGHVLAFAASVPEGYEPISFDQLRMPGESEAIPESAIALNGKKVYVRGYLHPSVSSLGNVNQFIVVGDFETCCFGGEPKLTHMIEVTTPPDQAVQYSLRRRGFAGILRVDPRLKPVEGLGGVYYQLRADIVH